MTEKFWQILKTDLIPIVIQPSKAAYKKIAPPNSFIHVEDFNYDYVKLAEYLKKVSIDFKIYLKYHAWKLNYYSVYKKKQTNQHRLCELCRKLNSESSSIYYENIQKWFDGECS